jgi:NAD(P)H-dependent FMN reductase
VRRDRRGIKAARSLVERRRRGHEAALIDPVEARLPLLDRMSKSTSRAPEVLERLVAQIRAADGFIVVSGEYNHGIPPAPSNLRDHFLEGSRSRVGDDKCTERTER